MQKVNFQKADSTLTLTSKTELKAFIEILFKKEKTPLATINYIFCSDKYLLSINQQFLNHDTYTDIITFGLHDKGTPVVAEVYISTDRVKENAATHGVTYTNVIRLVSMDSTFSTVNAPIIGATDVIIERTQYEYYDIANSNMPVLMITTIKMISSVLNDEQTLVLASDDPMQYVGLNNAALVNFTVSPNPSSDEIIVAGEFSSDATYTLIDQNGSVLSSSSVNNGTIIDISSFANGMYFLNINSNGNTTSKTIVKK